MATLSAHTHTPPQQPTSAPEQISIAEALERLKAGELVAFRLNGRLVLSCDPYNDAAVQRVNELKRRQPGRPLALIVDSMRMATSAQISSPLMHLLGRFHPYLTVSIPSPPGVSRFAHHGVGMVGVGLVGEGLVGALLEAFGKPLLVSSANPTGEPSPRTLTEMRAYGFDVPTLAPPSEEPSLTEPIEAPSVTVVTLAHSRLRLLSEGSVSEEALNDEWERLRALAVV
jgi:L-threonylcarbamoyladenylate synthase